MQLYRSFNAVCEILGDRVYLYLLSLFLLVSGFIYLFYLSAAMSLS